MSEDKYIALANKLKELANRGVGGEKTNAQAALDRLMKKYNISPEDLESEDVGLYWMKVGSGDQLATLFQQVASTVIGLTPTYSDKKYKKGKLGIKCTQSQAIEVEAKFGFYKSLYQKELDVFVVGFITANELFPLNGNIISYDDMTPEEREQRERASALAGNIKKGTFAKQLST